MALVVLSVVGCIQTRESAREQDEKQVLRRQLSNLQQTSADVNSRFQDAQDDIRALNGRIESVENHMGKLDQKSDKSQVELEARLKDFKNQLDAYREEIEGLKSQLVATAAMEKSRDSAADAEKERREKFPLTSAEESFGHKRWKEAILDYERFRKANPKSKQFAMATYKIGLSFQELGLLEEAKAFYEEVLQKSPRSKEASQAKAHLKSLASKR
jgi:TolA-binding protein